LFPQLDPVIHAATPLASTGTCGAKSRCDFAPQPVRGNGEIEVFPVRSVWTYMPQFERGPCTCASLIQVSRPAPNANAQIRVAGRDQRSRLWDRSGAGEGSSDRSSAQDRQDHGRGETGTARRAPAVGRVRYKRL
jgi:hypothetical protein